DRTRATGSQNQLPHRRRSCGASGLRPDHGDNEVTAGHAGALRGRAHRDARRLDREPPSAHGDRMGPYPAPRRPLGAHLVQHDLSLLRRSLAGSALRRALAGAGIAVALAVLTSCGRVQTNPAASEAKRDAAMSVGASGDATRAPELFA